MRILSIACVIIGMFVTLGSASAAPRLRVSDGDAVPHIIRVSGGCGIGFHRGPFGYCVQNGYAPPDVAVPYVAPVVVVPRACPLGYHLGPYGRACWAN